MRTKTVLAAAAALVAGAVLGVSCRSAYAGGDDVGRIVRALERIAVALEKSPR